MTDKLVYYQSFLFSVVINKFISGQTKFVSSKRTRNELTAYMVTINNRMGNTFNHFWFPDGMTFPYHERPYVMGFISKKLWKKFSQNILKHSYIKIVIHSIDKNTRKQKIKGKINSQFRSHKTDHEYFTRIYTNRHGVIHC